MVEFGHDLQDLSHNAMEPPKSNVSQYGMIVGYGRILVTMPVESQWAAPNYLPYTASKWALMALQEEWYATHSTTGAITNIDFVAILPGTVNSSLGYLAIYGKPCASPCCTLSGYTCGA